jgi:hypothetical protein
MTTDSSISLECQRGNHRELCLSQDHCVCTCHDPVGLDADTDEGVRRREQRPQDYETRVAGEV